MTELQTEVILAGKNKNRYFQQVLENMIKSLKHFEHENIITTQEINEYMIAIENISKMIKTCEELIHGNSNILTCLQDINNSLFTLMKQCGTYCLYDLLYICFGQDFEKELCITDITRNKFNALLKYIKPYKFNHISKTKKHNYDNDIIKKGNNLDCFDVNYTDNFECKVNGIRIIFKTKTKNTIIVHGIVENVVIHCSDIPYVNAFQRLLKTKKEANTLLWNNYVDNICLKSYILYNTEEIISAYNDYIEILDKYRNMNMAQLVRDFLNETMYQQRNILLIFLLDVENVQSQYKSYLLYDLLSNDANEIIDTRDQIRILNSFTWNMKKAFRRAMKHTVDYTMNITKHDNISIPFEQHICLLNAPNVVKEKAMVKLKEIKAKSEDSGGKARQYLEGLLKIPFGEYKKEPVLHNIQRIKKIYADIIQTLDGEAPPNISGFEIMKNVKQIESNLEFETYSKIDHLAQVIVSGKRKHVIDNIKILNDYFKLNNIPMRISQSGHSKQTIKSNIIKNLQGLTTENIHELYTIFNMQFQNKHIVLDKCVSISDIWKEVNDSIVRSREILNNAVHGHEEAKKSIEKIIGQWMNGDLRGYCFGFEGPPGVGKTSLAKKGLAKTLVDVNGETRPFRFIAIGGSSNGSTLEGHNYTYVGSTWGRIVDILMESKCMNPIIFIDELDKVSQTEHGKEIVGILTHLVDPTQNDDFQDKYFNGISIDLSKVLFVFSYNDPSLIDKILLDRIHRIKFSNLNESEKLVIAEKYILPEIYEKIGLNENVVQFEENVLKHIINHYTFESGVRKLKEILFDILSEINIDLFEEKYEYPCVIRIEDLKSRFLKNKHEVRPTTILKEDKVGLICGLWANSLGLGGILPIQAKFFPSNTFLDLKLTGMQGDVMKESMTVAKTVAFNLTPSNIQTQIRTRLKKSTIQGLHIHCPEGATPKDGPSAGGAITTCIYSLLNDKCIKKDIAMTGEITLEGNITAIGGLEYKILGGIKAGVKLFIYPEDNKDDFIKIKAKYTDIESEAKFISVKTIQQIFEHVFV